MAKKGKSPSYAPFGKPPIAIPKQPDTGTAGSQGVLEAIGALSDRVGRLVDLMERDAARGTQGQGKASQEGPASATGDPEKSVAGLVAEANKAIAEIKEVVIMEMTLLPTRIAEELASRF